MKVFIFIFFLFITFFAVSQESSSKGMVPQEGEPVELDALVTSYTDQLIAIEAISVNCENVLDALKHYVDLSTKSYSLLSVSANRFLSGVSASSESTPEETEAQAADISNAVQLIPDSEFTLSDKAYEILNVLPSCLKE